MVIHIYTVIKNAARTGTGQKQGCFMSMRKVITPILAKKSSPCQNGFNKRPVVSYVELKQHQGEWESARFGNATVPP